MAPKVEILTDKFKNMAKKEKFIKLPKVKVEEIAGIKGVSVVTVYAALKYETDSALAMLIRSWALNNGGTLFEEIANPYQRVAIIK